MKFGKRLHSQLEETLPEWKDKYLSYKQLKKRLKLISAPECLAEGAPTTPPHGGFEPDAQTVVDIQSGKEGRLDLDENTSAVAGRGLDEAPARAAAADSQNSSVNGAGAVTEDGAGISSSASDGVDMQESKLDIRGDDLRNLTVEELDFIHLLNAELEKFNTFFVEKEEEYVIRLQELKERIERVKEKSGLDGILPSESDLNEEMIKIRKDFVNFHGEMVLLENYSSLNYTGLVKILKKHDKRTGALLRMPFIQSVLHQPFFTTELLSKLVRECETNLQSLFPSFPALGGLAAECSKQDHEDPVAEKEGTPENKGPSCIHGEDVENIYRSTMAALRTIKDLRKGSSTYSVFSLPPCRSENEEPCFILDSNGKTPCATISICPKD